MTNDAYVNSIATNTLIWLTGVITGLILLISFPCSAQTKLNFATVHSPPLCEKEAPGNGVFTAITREAFKRAGYSLKVRFVPWKRGFIETQKGISDGLMLVSYKADRIHFFHYTEPVVKERGVLFAKKNRHIEYSNLEDLASYSIGALRASLLSGKLKAENLTVNELTTFAQTLSMLKNDRLDLVASNEMVFYHLINTKYPELKGKFKVLLPPLHIGNLHNVISLKHPNHNKIVGNFNKGLREIHQDGTFASLMKEHGLVD
ncbi:MAG: transporter substrate-binding domain-containing protein [Desulfobacteraceae bacterium]|nr:transporter substrate-binding domain-containing protein [Desulfobacteraceae bacterium]